MPIASANDSSFDLDIAIPIAKRIDIANPKTGARGSDTATNNQTEQSGFMYFEAHQTNSSGIEARKPIQRDLFQHGRKAYTFIEMVF
jgi:hypothetical protein